jgi:hypothetical protein
MCPAALDPATVLWRAPALPCATQFQTPPPCSGGLRRYHMPRGSGPYLPAQEGSSVVTCPTTLNPASLLGRALALPRVP